MRRALAVAALAAAAACAVAQKDAAPPPQQQAADDAEQPAVAAPASPLPDSAPLWTSDVPLLDAALAHPWQRSVRHVKAGLRGFWHAARDVLFPEYRADGPRGAPAVDPRRRPHGSLDAPLPDEGALEYERRLAWRAWFLAGADAAGVPALHGRNPAAVRNGFAVLVGCLLMATVAATNAVAAACARAVTKAVWRETWTEIVDGGGGGDDGDEDDGGKDAAAAAAPAAAGTTAPPAAAAGGLRRRKGGR